MINLPVNVAEARLPAAYEAAKQSLAKCERVDECKSWADKAAALASYAKQAKDESLMNHARRIQIRAIDQMGSLVQKLEKRQGYKARVHAVDTTRGLPRSTRLAEAGITRNVARTAIAVNNVPRDEFEALVESDKPPTVTKLAERGRKRRTKVEKARDEEQERQDKTIMFLRSAYELCRDSKRLKKFSSTIRNLIKEIES